MAIAPALSVHLTRPAHHTTHRWLAPPEGFRQLARDFAVQWSGGSPVMYRVREAKAAGRLTRD